MAILAVTAFASTTDAVDDALEDPNHPINQHVAQVDGNTCTMSQAIVLANGNDKTILLIENYYWQVEVPQDYEIRIDLNGHLIYPQDGGNPFINYGTLMITNSSQDEATIGGATTNHAIYNTGTLTIAPDTTSGGIKVHGSVVNGNDNEHINANQSITINDGTSVIGKTNVPTLMSLNDGVNLIINGGTFTHEGRAELIDFIGDGFLYIYGGVFKAADSYPILSSYSSNNSIEIGSTESKGPTFTGNTDGDSALFVDRMFYIRENTKAMSFYSGTVTQDGDGIIFEFGVSLLGGEIKRQSGDSEYPLIHSTSGLWIGTSVEGSSIGPLILCEGQVGLSESGSITQTGTGYAVECDIFYTSDGIVEAVGDAILCHGNIEINGDNTKPTITSQTGYCFVARYGSLEGGVYNFGSDANVINLDIDPDNYNGITFDGNAVINETPIGSISGPLTYAYGIEPVKLRYGFQGTESSGVAIIYKFSTDQWMYTETREAPDESISAVYSATNDEGTFLYENMDAAALAFPDEEDLRTLTLLENVDTASLTVPAAITLNLNGHSIDALHVTYGSNITVNGTGKVSSATNEGYLRINGGTFESIDSEISATLEVNGGSFSEVPLSAIVPDELSFVQNDEGLWVLQKIHVIEVDGTRYYSYKEAEGRIYNGSEVTLLCDGFKPLTIGNGEDGIRNVTLDMNGFYIDYGNGESITINRGVVATIVDDNPSDTGTFVMNAGNLTITGGTFSTIVNYGLGESNILTIRDGTFLGNEDGGNTPPSLIIGDPEGASTVKITGGHFTGPLMSWDIYPDDGRTPKIYIGGGTFHGTIVGQAGEDYEAAIISPKDAGFMVSGGMFIEISEEDLQTGYTLRQSDGMYQVVLSESATISKVTLDENYADEEVIIELPSQTIVSDGVSLVIPTLEDGFQNMTVEVGGKKFTTVVEVSNGVIVNDVDMSIPDGTTTVDNQKLEADQDLSKTVVSNINSVLGELDGEKKEVEVVLSPSPETNTAQILSQSGGEASFSIDININTIVNNTAETKSETSSLLEFIIPVPEKDLGKSIQVYRMHDNAGVSEITALPQLESRFGVSTEGFVIENGYIHIFAQKFSTYTAVTGSETVEDDDDDIIVPPWGWEEDDYVPPIYVPSQTTDDDDTVKIVACAAAAAVAAILAVFLIVERKR